jgi:hypothetical protein
VKKREGQCRFDFDAAPEVPAPIPVPVVVLDSPKAEPEAEQSIPPRKLDVAGHRRWASFCRFRVEITITEASKATDVKEIGEWAGIAKIWKEQAAMHDAKADVLERGGL